jgi:hypothetical protein
MGTDRSFDYATVKYSSLGVTQWLARYSGPDEGYDEATSLTLDAAGNVYVTGYSFGRTTSADYVTIKYNHSGVQQWIARYDYADTIGQGGDFA